MIKLGITGGIGSGKSTVSQIFSLSGVPVYIADTESKKLVASSPVIKKKLINLLGKEIYEGDILNKALLASLIFNDKEKLAIVNSIIHPEVEKDFIMWVDTHQQSKIVAHEAAILFESGFNKLMDKVVMVYTPLDIRIERTMRRDNVSHKKVLERIENQMSDEDKVKLSDFVIVNDGGQSLIEQVQNIIQHLKVL